MKNPTQIIKQTGKRLFKITYKFVGENAQIVLNKVVRVVTAIVKHKIGRRVGAWIVSLGLGFLVGRELLVKHCSHYNIKERDSFFSFF